MNKVYYDTEDFIYLGIDVYVEIKGYEKIEKGTTGLLIVPELKITGCKNCEEYWKRFNGHIRYWNIRYWEQMPTDEERKNAVWFTREQYIERFCERQHITRKSFNFLLESYPDMAKDWKE